MNFTSFQTPRNINEIMLTSGPLKYRQLIALDKTIPATMAKTIETGRLDAFRLNWKEGMPKEPHHYWDSDTAKVLEGMAAALALRPDAELEAEFDRWVDLIVSAQQPDGYLNTCYTVVAPEKRLKNLCDNHELYCCGHLIEAAVAAYLHLGKRKLLDCLCRYADFLVSYFGPGKHPGWPGHQEIELALMKLYRVTGKKEYLDLAKYFIDSRGTTPHFFRDIEKSQDTMALEQNQTHLPLRQQTTAVGHAVRAVYFLTGAADVAAETKDESLLAACETIFENIRTKRMYVTGGIGSTFHLERFTKDYDLSNGSQMYAESCAAIGLTNFCQRMMNITGEEKYTGVLEQALFNGVLSGISLDGDKFFYTNYLEVDENLQCYNSGKPVRQEWFNCSCCPTNFARFLTQMQQYLFSVNDAEQEIRIQVPADSEFRHTFSNGTTGRLDISGGYPYKDSIKVTILEDGEYTLSLRIPGWCHKTVISHDGKIWDQEPAGSFFKLRKNWKIGDILEVHFDMPVEFLHCNGKVTCNAGRIAVRRGPVVYCIESGDITAQNGNGEVRNFLIDTTARPQCVPVPGSLPQYATAIRLQGLLEIPADKEALYFTGNPSYQKAEAIAIPYALWNNRGKTNMAVWIREKSF